MAGPDRSPIDRPRPARRALLLVLVALSAVAGWTVAPSGATAARSASSVAGAVVKPAGPALVRAARGPVAVVLARAAQHASHTQRTLNDERPVAHGGGLLAVLGALVAAAALARRTRRLPRSDRRPFAAVRSAGHGRAPPAALPIPA